ncbi:MAG TPA: ThiF family adenylyltransferase [Thermoanaerobaculia bacterium]|nr:ThiF family adenylyltransferase [Thermoanaerobaculia bacterium]
MLSPDRHSRHRLFQPIGDQGQETIANARITLVGCGALGSHAAALLVRAGVGTGDRGWLRIIDRDTVEISNLQRQALFDSRDAQEARPKATAAAEHLTAIDPGVRLDPVVRDFNPSNAARLVRDAELLLDGTDNFRTRFLINDVAIAKSTPWIYGGAIASRGVVATIVPGVTPCLRCHLFQTPPLGATETCDTVGVITPLPALVASLQVTAALRWLVERSFDRGVLAFDLWNGETRFQRILVDAVPRPECRSCGTAELPGLSEEAEQIITLCGRNSVQIFSGREVALDSLEQMLATVAGPLHRSPESLTIEIPEGRLTLFDDGRLIVEGTTDPMQAQSIAARYIGA